jgi:hypothetical protein
MGKNDFTELEQLDQLQRSLPDSQREIAHFVEYDKFD